ncbi:MAG: 2-oxoacid:ferredoxin oxidoreductase subunit beta [Anaerolineae bacterium]|jgi:2-oxoglutarate ferredoxin oxidoreductase subunit beta|nr:2-oxoacid:ferredoxin oxidoreductase subunit beta [Anaerolineae bacterium]
MTDEKKTTNAIGLTRQEYQGSPSTLCKGCGHNAIVNQLIQACYELDLRPEDIVKFSGIGCSSKAPTYLLRNSFGFNGLHGRMPSLALGALFADRTLLGLGMSGDGDTASIGMSQFKHICRRNPPMLYIVANNGVYGLTKGQFSATTEPGVRFKRQGTSRYQPVDICLEALASNASFVARSFAGDPKQMRSLFKAAFRHKGIAVIDIISPCVSFFNFAQSLHSYEYGMQHEIPLHELEFVPNENTPLVLKDFEKGTVREVQLHDKSSIRLKKLDKDYDPTNRWEAFKMLQEAEEKRLMVTGLIYLDPDPPLIFDRYNLVEEPLNRLPEERLRPSRESLEALNRSMM